MHLLKVIASLLFLTGAAHALENSSKSPSVSMTTRTRNPVVSTHPPSVAPSLQKKSTKATAVSSNHPSSRPSVSPEGATEVPTQYATLASESPSQTPTIGITMLPTQRPSLAPSETLATQHPNLASEPPSQTPTIGMTMLPTQRPSLVPSEPLTTQHPNLASEPPSQTPTIGMTMQPTQRPSLAPSRTLSPSIHPSVFPSVSSNPSFEPSIESTLSQGPSLEPSIQTSPVPSSQPTTATSSKPSSNPSFGPSIEATLSQGPSLEPSIQASPVPSSQPTTAKSSKPSSNPSFGPSIEATLSQGPSLKPSMQASPMPSSQPTTATSSKPSSMESLKPSIQFSSKPSLLKSSLPSVSISQMPSLIPTPSPSISPSTVPSSNPTSFPDSLHNATLSMNLYARRKLDKEEKRLFEGIAKDFILSTDEAIYIEYVTFTSQYFEQVRDRQLSAAETVKGEETNLHVVLIVKGRLLSLDSGSTYLTHLEDILHGGDFKAHLTDALLVFRKEDNPLSVIDARKEKTDDVGNLGGLIAKIGAGIGGAGILIIAAFFVKGRSRGRWCNVNQDDGVYIVEADPDTGIDTDDEIPDVNQDDAFEDRDRFSIFTYSETSSEFVHDVDPFMSLTSSSLASGTRTTITSHNEYPSTSAVLLPKGDLRSPDMPLQHARPQALTLKKTSRDDYNSKESQSVDSFVEGTEVVQPIGEGMRRMFSCFGPTTNHGGVGFRHTISGLMSEKTPRISNIHGHESIQIGRNQSEVSAVSSISGKSSCSGSISLRGEPFEVVVPANRALGLIVKSSNAGPQILHVKKASPLTNMVQEGDFILSVDGIDARFMSARELSKWLHRNENISGERTMILMSEQKFHACKDDGSDFV